MCPYRKRWAAPDSQSCPLITPFHIWLHHGFINHIQTKIHPSCCPNSLPLKTHVVCFKNFSIYMWPVFGTHLEPGLGTRPGNPACEKWSETQEPMSWRFPSKYDKYDSQLQIWNAKKKSFTRELLSQPHPVTRLWRMRDIASEIWSAKSLPVLDFLAETVHAPLRGHHRASQVDVLSRTALSENDGFSLTCFLNVTAHLIFTNLGDA